MNPPHVARWQNPILASPIIIFLLLLLGFPTLLNIFYSFSAVGFSNLRTPSLQGLDNYRAVMADPRFWQASWFSVRFAVITAFAECILGLMLAVFLAPLLQKRPWLLAILMMPMMISPAMMGLMYRLVLHEFVGPLPHYLYAWFGDSPSFLGLDTVFRTVIVIETLQWTPFVILLCYMAYNAINPEIREAATVDGARSWQLFWKIELPLMLPTLLVAFFIRFIDGFRIFDNIFVLVGSGPGGSTTSLSIYIYQTFFRAGDIGKAIAASVVLFGVSFVVLYAAAKLFKLRNR